MAKFDFTMFTNPVGTKIWEKSGSYSETAKNILRAEGAVWDSEMNAWWLPRAASLGKTGQSQRARALEVISRLG